jgi:hypothetical protein
MRLLHRHEADPHDEHAHGPDTVDRAPDDPRARSSWRSVFHRTDDPDGGTTRDRTATDADRAVAARNRRDRAELERDRAEAERDRDDARRDEVHEEIVERRKRWDTAGFLTTAFGAALATVGVVALVRTGVDDSWYRPVVEVAGIRHSPLLGAIEVAAGAALVLTLLLGLRMVAALLALAGGIAATVVALEPSRVNPELAIERGWAIALAVASLALGLFLVATRDRRRERRVIHRPVTARSPA